MSLRRPDRARQERGSSGSRRRGFLDGAEVVVHAQGQTDRPKYLVCNADESEPGSFKDRIIMERGPHQMLEGILIAAWATGASTTFIYIRGEYSYPADCRSSARSPRRTRRVIWARM